MHLIFTPLKRPFKRTLSPHAAGCLLVALGPLRPARRMGKKVENGDLHEHAKVRLRARFEGTSKLFRVFSQCFHTLYAPTFRPLAAICRPWDRPPAPGPTTTRPQTPPETSRCYTRAPRGVKRCAAAPSRAACREQAVWTRVSLSQLSEKRRPCWRTQLAPLDAQPSHLWWNSSPVRSR